MKALQLHVLLRLVRILSLLLQCAVHHASEEGQIDLQLVVSPKVGLILFRGHRGVGGASDTGGRGGGEEWGGRGGGWDWLRLRERDRRVEDDR